MGNNIQKFNQFINEGLSSKVYHFTFIGSLLGILKENALQTTSVLSSPYDRKKNDGHFFYLSLTSSGHTDIGYAASLPKDRLVRIELDGSKLNYNLKSKRVDYWGRPKDPTDPLYKSYRKHNNDNEFYRFLSRQDELEDRIVTDKPVIEDINKYITNISIILDKERVLQSNDLDDLKEVEKLALDLGIPLYVYNEINDFNFNRMSRSLNLDNLESTESMFDRNNRRPTIMVWSRLLALMIYEEKELSDSIINDIETGKYTPIEYKTGDFAKSFNLVEYVLSHLKKDSVNYLNYTHIDATRRDYPIDGYISSIEADIHNDKSSSNILKHYTLRRLTNEMRKHKCDTLFDYVKYKLTLRD